MNIDSIWIQRLRRQLFAIFTKHWDNCRTQIEARVTIKEILKFHVDLDWTVSGGIWYCLCLSGVVVHDCHVQLSLLIRCIRMLVTKILGNISVAITRTHGRGEVPLLSSGWTLIGSELSSPNFNSSVRAVRSFAIRYLNVVKPLCGNLDFCWNY